MSKTKRKWEDITDILTDKGKAELQVGQVLKFDYEGSPLWLKIVRKRGGKVWAKKTELYTADELGPSEQAVIDAMDNIE